ncbi:flavin-containing monooxygenase [Actinacidiphila yeochonensis]|uniref:flavin-containing monooxygenase n=1 Tax=Actinacidiphila yeochonensis TaxID=89050 RepID=UPI00068F73F5|nr:FAD-dependent oxidoreductase [Actinacidiphila yeochonensis]
MEIAVIGAGPAGLTSAKQALERGHQVVVYEREDDLGGIWNPAAGGAYDSVRMQSSVMSFPFSDYPPPADTAFPTQAEVHTYLTGYAREFGVAPATRYRHTVTRVVKRDGRWQVTARCDGQERTDTFDAVMVASGELWESRRPEFVPDGSTGVQVITAKDYRAPRSCRGQRVLVIGGGVSGADIAGELAADGRAVDWSVRHRALFLPRRCGGILNDAFFSYIGRVAVEELPYQDYLKRLEEDLPQYLTTYRESGLLPEDGFHGAIHVNDRIVEAVHSGRVQVRPSFTRFDEDGSAVFSDGSRERYDTVVLCLGYGLPDYRFLPEMDRHDLYEHFFWSADPTLAIINTPVDTEAFGTACPYFEMIAAWALRVFDGTVQLPPAEERAAWCARHMARLDDRRYYDCWLETVRLGLIAGVLPDPARDFDGYWRLIAGQVAPAGLLPDAAPVPAGVRDDWFDLTVLRHRVLAGLDPQALAGLVAAGQVTAEDAAAARAVPADRAIAPWLPYRQRSATVSFSGKEIDGPSTAAAGTGLPTGAGR